MNALDDINLQLDPACSPDANLSHLKHVFAGYRDYMTNQNERSEFSPGSARDVSWTAGVKMAMRDLQEGIPE